ncbi:SusD family outer membrane lipoprotein NanU [Larkinella knui]|uniref:RagB/SusD family nutrient uptake outer membrane protein n=1 Tax=Larkinella knui TaxID=2025310 RepID=A0A3P1CPJ9_9BACT|nr:RagB/SusD family nutrient uptake outer membrane protein [Larkinella knui]RRB14874.1 RagB/SusD family nutrient uptake outer membrane protein [Larkinella knui]
MHTLRYKLGVALSAILLGTVTSCTDSLDVKPTSLITVASYWQKEDDAKGALYGMYIRLRSEAVTNLFVMGEARSETLTSALVGTLSFDRYYDNSLDANMGTLITWQTMYSVVNAANLLIKYTPTIKFTSEASKNDILAQAYTTRAFMYYAMVRTWGALPLRTEPIEGYDPQTIQVGRSPEADVFALIKADLDKALSLYPTNTIAAGRSIWSKPATNALKADVYLWTGKRMNGGQADFTKALEACNAVQTADVTLLPNFADLFSYTNKGNKEILMAVRFQALESVDNFYFNGYVANGAIPTNLEASSVSALGVPGGNSVWSPTAAVRNQFTTDDQRRNATFRELYTVDAAGVRKLYTPIIVKGTGTVENNVRYFASDVILYRYADLLLLKAEAKNALGQDPSPEINLVRQRAYGTNAAAHVFVNGTKEQNDDAILQERLLELAYEGKRWWDLRRFGKVFDKVPSLQSKKGQESALLFPISTTTLSLEPLVKQNAGY